MSNYFCFNFSFRKDINNGKIKIDYFLIPVVYVSQNEKIVNFKSTVSGSFFKLKKEPNEILGKELFSLKEKGKNFLSFTFVIEVDSDELELTEQIFLPKIAKKICSKIPFKFKLKRKLLERVKQIMEN